MIEKVRKAIVLMCLAFTYACSCHSSELSHEIPENGQRNSGLPPHVGFVVVVRRPIVTNMDERRILLPRIYQMNEPSPSVLPPHVGFVVVVRQTIVTNMDERRILLPRIYQMNEPNPSVLQPHREVVLRRNGRRVVLFNIADALQIVRTLYLQNMYEEMNLRLFEQFYNSDTLVKLLVFWFGLGYAR